MAACGAKRAAIAIQSAVETRKQEPPLKVLVGIHAGDPISVALRGIEGQHTVSDLRWMN